MDTGERQPETRNGFKLNFGILLAFSTIPLLLSCGKTISANNPYDPSSPLDQQAKGTITGSLVMEAAGNPGQATVSVPKLGLQRNPKPDGKFEIDGLPAGVYELAFKAEGYEDTQRIVEISPGSVRNIGQVDLKVIRATIRGTVSLLSLGDREHQSPGGTVIQVVPSGGQGGGLPALGSAYAGIAAPDGTFAINDVPVGDYDLSADRDGFAKRSLCGIKVERGGTDIAETIQLPPVTGLVEIENNAKYTNKRTVDLTILAFNTSEMMLSVSPDFSGAEYEEYSPKKSFKIAGDKDKDGIKSVYSKFRVSETGCGTTDYRESDRIESSIILDTKPPHVVDVQLGSGSSYSNDLNVGLFANAYDETSGVNSMQLAIDEELKDQPWQDFTLQQALAFKQDGTHSVAIRFSDRAGNISQTVTKEITVDTKPPVPGDMPIQIGDGTGILGSRTTVVKLDATDDTPLAFKLCEVQGCPATEYVPMTNLVSWVFSGDGEHTMYVMFKDAAGNESPEYSASVTVDTEPPQLSLVTVDEGDFVNKRLVNLSIDADGADYFRISETPTFRNSQWETFRSNKPFLLDDRDGPHRIFVQLADQAGNRSKVSAAQVVLDRIPPQDTLVHIASGNYTNSESVTVELSVDDPSGTYMVVSADDDFNEPLQSFSPTVIHLLASVDTPQKVYVRFYDRAGNHTDTESDNTVILDTEAPTPPVLHVPAQIINADQIDVSLLAPSTDNSGQALVYQLRTQGANWIQLTRQDFPFTVKLEQDRGNLIRVRALDPAGNAGAEESVVVVEDSTPPTDPVFMNTRMVVNADSLDLLLASPSIDENFDTYEIKINDGPWQNSGVGNGSLKIPVQLLPDNEHRIRLRAKDLAGNLSNAAEITVVEDSTPPTTPTLLPPEGTVNADTAYLLLAKPSTDTNRLHYELAVGQEGTFHEITPGQDNSFPVQLDQDKENIFLFRAVDEAGNVSSTSVSKIDESSTEVMNERNDNVDDNFDVWGRYFAYTQNIFDSTQKEWSSDIYIQDLFTDQVQKVDQMGFAGNGIIWGIRLAANSLMWIRDWLYLFDFQTGVTVLPAPSTGGDIRSFAWDGQVAAFCLQNDGANIYIWHKGAADVELVDNGDSESSCRSLDIWNGILAYAIDDTLYSYNTGTAAKKVIADPAGLMMDNFHVSTDGRYVAWSGGDTVFPMIMAYDLDSDQSLGPVNYDEGTTMEQNSPRLRDGLLVYEDYSNGNPSIILHDFSSGSNRDITSDIDGEKEPAVSGRFVAYRRSHGKTKSLELNEVAQRAWLLPLEGSQAWGAVNGREIAFADSRPGFQGITGYNYKTRSIIQSIKVQSNVRVCGLTDTHMAYQQVQGSRVDLFLLDRQTGTTVKVNDPDTVVPDCALDHQRICWQDFHLQAGGGMPPWGLYCRDVDLASPPQTIQDNQNGTIQIEGEGLDLDGDRLLFGLRDEGSNEKQPISFYLYDFDKGPPPLLLDKYNKWDADSFGPDERTVALSDNYACWVEHKVENRGLPDEKYVYSLILEDLSSTVKTEIFKSEEWIAGPSFKFPYLAFETSISGNREVMLVTIPKDGSAPKLDRVTRNQFYQGKPLVGDGILYWLDGRLGGWDYFYMELNQ